MHPVHFLSLGPGNARLVTLQVFDLLQTADIIYCPATQMGNRFTSRAAAILKELGMDETKIRTFVLPMSDDRSRAKAVYASVAEEVMNECRKGKQTAVAAEGDISIYASIHYMMNYIVERGFPVTQQSGIPSFIAATETEHFPLVLLEERLVVIPGNTTEEELKNYLNSGHTVVIMKLSRCETAVKAFVRTHPEQYTYRYSENVSTDKAYFTTLPEEICLRAFPYFSMLTIASARKSLLD